ncbi:uncharacterized protein LOC144444523 [Glandiceps talaboti]
MAISSDDTDLLEILIPIFDDLDHQSFERFKTRLKACKIKGETIAKRPLAAASTSDHLANLMTANFKDRKKCLSTVKTILWKIPRRDIIGDDRFKHLFQEEIPEESPFPGSQQKNIPNVKSLPPKVVNVNEGVLSSWKEQLAYSTDKTTSILFMKKLVSYSDSVGIIGKRGSEIKGSGFRVGAQYFITNFHVLQMMLHGIATDDLLKQMVGDLVVCFNFEDTLQQHQQHERVQSICYY